MVSAASVAIDTKNHADAFAAIDFFDGSGKLAAGGIAVVDFAAAGKQAHTVRSSRRRIGADNIVIEHPTDGVALLLGPIEQMIASEQALSFAGNGGEEERGAVCAFAACSGSADETGGFHADGNT